MCVCVCLQYALQGTAGTLQFDLGVSLREDLHHSIYIVVEIISFPHQLLIELPTFLEYLAYPGQAIHSCLSRHLHIYTQLLNFSKDQSYCDLSKKLLPFESK